MSALLVALIVALVTPLIAYFTASRRLSGKIGTSDADKLWDEADRQRKDYREQIEGSNKRILTLETRIAEVERDNNALARENYELIGKIRNYEATIALMQKQLDDQAITIVDLRALVTTLQQSQENSHG